MDIRLKSDMMFNIRWLFTTGFILLVTNVIIFYFTNFDFTDIELVSYVFLHVSYVCLMIVPCIVPNTVGVGVYTYTKLFVVVTYLIMALIVGIIPILFFDEIKLSILIQTMVMASFFIVIGYVILIDRESEKNEVADTMKVKERRDHIIRLEVLMNRIVDVPSKKAVEHACDAIKSSSMPFNGIDTSDIGTNIDHTIDKLEAAVISKNSSDVMNYAKEIEGLVVKRNQAIDDSL